MERLKEITREIALQNIKTLYAHTAYWMEQNDLSLIVNAYFDFLNAEREGRLVVLPCKVGDTVYVDKRTICDGWRTKGISSEIAVGRVVAFSKNSQSAFMKIEFLYNQGTVKFRDRYVISAIGKTVFLTRSEAEAALAEKEKKHE